MKKAQKKTFLEHHPEAKGLFLLCITLVMILSLCSFHPDVPSQNWLGLVGYAIAYALTYLLGLASYLLMGYLSYIGIKLLSRGKFEHIRSKNFYFGIFLISMCLLLNLIAETKTPFPLILADKVPIETIILDLPYPHMHVRHNLGGIPLYYLYTDIPSMNLKHLLSNVGIGITFSITAFVSILLFTETRLHTVWQWGRKRLEKTEPKEKPMEKVSKQKKGSYASSIKRTETKKPDYPQPIFPPAQTKRSLFQRQPKEPEPKPKLADEHFNENPPLPRTKAAATRKLPSRVARRAEALRAQRVHNGEFSQFQLPATTLLRSPKKVDTTSLKQSLKVQAGRLEETLASFGIEAKVGEINCGPTITSFEVHPSVGVKVQKITALSNDIALNLQAKSIRIIAPIPGKAAVGVEIPSLIPQEVSFKELLMNYQRSSKKAAIPILLGKSVSGEIVTSDLAKMPHCIIAGATGSGKSVCINTIVMSIVMTARPDEVKLLMVDPKKVELTGYSNLPHMIAPVITEAHGAYAALNWLVKEMQLRYEILKQLKLRNITAFNSRKPNKEFEESLDIEIPERMPKFVAIIDEFADLMMASSSDLETPIARIAQMARAVGIHMILATQRPSREVITGLIKANFPTRISFKVASRINSQIILDETGAENLLGNGDMLFLPPGTSHLIRAQGSYISDEEINEVIDYVCNQAPSNYLIPSFDTMPKEDLGTLVGLDSDESKDSLYDEARSIVIETGSASTTFLQRKLKIGYARAASLMDELEDSGIIGPQEGARPRRLLVSSSASETSTPPGKNP